MSRRTADNRQRAGVVPPGVDGGRCVHALAEGASCQACVDACPRGAWVLDDEQLGIDPDRCDGCGVCAAVCPTQAIEELARPLRYRVEGQEQAWAACRSSGIHGPGLLGCLQALGVDALARLAAEGVVQVFLSRGDCSHCPCDRKGDWDRALTEVNRLLGDQGRRPLVFTWLSGDAWSRARHAAAGLHRAPGLDRRSFFHRALGELEERLQPESREGPVTARQRLPSHRPDRWRAYGPRIDPGRCQGCDACVRLCPAGAISWRADPPSYLLDADACNGCRLCVDHCQPEALTLEEGIRSPQAEVPLRVARCPSCGVRFHVPERDDSQQSCPVCRVRSHASRLFQVFD